MALKPNNTRQPSLSEEDVIKIRKLFFEKNWSYFEIEDETGIKYGLLRKAIHGRGKFYASIEDGIPQEVKDSRVRYNELARKNKVYGNMIANGYEHEEARKAAGLPESYFKMDWED